VSAGTDLFADSCVFVHMSPLVGFTLCRMTEVARFKQGVANALLFCAARQNKPIYITQLLGGAAGVAAQLNVVDDFGRSPLYWAVQVCSM
jgi:hypothetical protein